MAIPGYQEILLPLLQLVGDGREWHIKDTKEILSDHFKLTEEERQQKIPSGYEPLIYNRIHWARLYLVRSGLLTATRRGYIRIAESGKHLLATKPSSLSTPFLRDKYPELREYLSVSTQKTKSSCAPDESVATQEAKNADETPEEILEQVHKTLKKQLAADLLDQIKEMPPYFFEQLVVDLLKKMGYGGPVEDAALVTPRSNDGGIDGIIKEDRLGLETIYIQAKRYKDTSVGRPEIQAFVGALHGRRSRKGVFITTSSFANQAVEYAKSIETRVVLIDGQRLAQYMIEFGLGVATTHTYEIKRIDSDYFNDD